MGCAAFCELQPPARSLSGSRRSMVAGLRGAAAFTCRARATASCSMWWYGMCTRRSAPPQFQTCPPASPHPQFPPSGHEGTTAPNCPPEPHASSTRRPHSLPPNKAQSFRACS